jgi:hypothetical protein
MDTDAGEAGVVSHEEAAEIVLAAGGGVGRAGVPARRIYSMDQRRRESSVQGVLADKDLLEYVFGFVGGATGRQSAKALGQVALVCREWREVSSRKDLWKCVEREVVPALWQEEQGGSGRGRLVQYGRLLVAERRVWSENDWSAGLELHVEVFDRMDGLQMLSARGTLEWKVEQHCEVTRLRLSASPAVEVCGASFSAASRDPEQRRFANIREYFTRGHQAEYPCSLCVRVTVRDQRTGKGGLLWEEGKEEAGCADPVPHWETRLPEGSIRVRFDARRIVWGRGDSLDECTSFHICPDPDQAGVADDQRLYRVAAAEANSMGDDHPMHLTFFSTDVAKISSMVRSVC